ncbi:TetR/AcrR family transcriptional regulator [Nocardiopsis protaetiae]|uniref:TetR/AcrR family transcriptional regulator n=1 Tax=Nocardiopsis protaetiae TaxID=3382270 RepID=UPI00387B76C4
MTTTDNPRTGARNRTRRAILAAAATVLGRDRNAPLAAVAEAADVGRSTLHRYFPDREELVAATFEDSIAELGRVMEQVRPEEGPADEALCRVVNGHVEVGDRILFAFGDTATAQRYGGYEPGEPEEPEVLVRLFERGQAEGVFDPDADPAWMVHVMWALLFTGLERARAGRLSPQAVAPLVLRTLENGVTARP